MNTRKPTALAAAALTFFMAYAPSGSTADLQRAQTIVDNKCYLCHGSEGEGSNAVYPRLAAQNQAYLAKQLTDFRAKRRLGTMNDMAADLSDEDIAALAQYFSSKPALTHRVSDEELAAVGRYLFLRGNKFTDVPACASCHGENGAGSEQLPRLAGQHKKYVATQLREFNQRTRTNDNAVMHSIAAKLTELEVEAIALFVSGLQ